MIKFWVHFGALLRVPGPAAPRPLTAGPLGHDGEPAAGQSPTARFNAFTARALAANGDGEHGNRRVQLACADWKTRSKGTTRNDPKMAALRLEVAGKLVVNHGGTVARTKLSMPTHHATGKRGKGSARSAISPRTRRCARRRRGWPEMAGIGEEARLMPCGKTTISTERLHPGKHRSARL